MALRVEDVVDGGIRRLKARVVAVNVTTPSLSFIYHVALTFLAVSDY
jgi:hypothetical protein